MHNRFHTYFFLNKKGVRFFSFVRTPLDVPFSVHVSAAALFVFLSASAGPAARSARRKNSPSRTISMNNSFLSKNSGVVSAGMPVSLFTCGIGRHSPCIHAAEHPYTRRAAVEGEIRNAGCRRHFDKRKPRAAEERHAPTAPVPHGSVTCVRLSHPAKALSLRHSSPRSKLTLTSWRQPKNALSPISRTPPPTTSCSNVPLAKNAFGAIAAHAAGRRFPSGFQCGAARPVSRP